MAAQQRYLAGREQPRRYSCTGGFERLSAYPLRQGSAQQSPMELHDISLLAPSFPAPSQHVASPVLDRASALLATSKTAAEKQYTLSTSLSRIGSALAEHGVNCARHRAHSSNGASTETYVARPIESMNEAPFTISAISTVPRYLFCIRYPGFMTHRTCNYNAVLAHATNVPCRSYMWLICCGASMESRL